MKRTEFARLTQAKWLDYIWRTKSVLTRGYKAVRSQSSRSRNVFILHGNRIHWSNWISQLHVNSEGSEFEGYQGIESYRSSGRASAVRPAEWGLVPWSLAV